MLRVPCSGKVLGEPEKALMHQAVEDLWLTAGRWNQRFEEGLVKATGGVWAATVNSGSSANLVAISALGLKTGDEVITVACGFPTTVNPIILNAATPVFVDVDLTYNADPGLIADAITDKTKAIVLAHTLGNPFDIGAVMELADVHGLKVVEDCCDSLGSTYLDKPVGTFGDLATLSFYPAHQITTGEGGAVFSSVPGLRGTVDSIRDWGRDCWCPPGAENTCGYRFEQQHGSLPFGYDHKYVYSRLGYNLKMTDMQAACGVAQLDRLEGFIAKRRENWSWLRKRLESCSEFLILPEPTPHSKPSWFGFCLTMKENCDFRRPDFLAYLAQEGVDSRQLFGGNLTRQPYMRGRNFRIHGSLKNTDVITEKTFWIGCWPGLNEEHLEWSANRIETFLGVR